MVVINIKGPEAIKSTVALSENSWFSLSSELEAPKIKIKITHRTSLGIVFLLRHAGNSKMPIMITGNIQASNIEAFPIRGGQL